MFLRHPLNHASPQDRAVYREQLAVVANAAPHTAAPFLDSLDPVERRAVEQIREILFLLAPPLRVERTADGGEIRYLGRPDGVYTQAISPYGVPGSLDPYGPWSLWNREQGHAP